MVNEGEDMNEDAEKDSDSGNFQKYINIIKVDIPVYCVILTYNIVLQGIFIIQKKTDTN